MSKPLTMTVEREAWYRSARGIACAPLYVPDLLAEVDALRAARAAAEAKLADECRHADALAEQLTEVLNLSGWPANKHTTLSAHKARRAAEVANG